MPPGITLAPVIPKSTVLLVFLPNVLSAFWEKPELQQDTGLWLSHTEAIRFSPRAPELGG